MLHSLIFSLGLTKLHLNQLLVELWQHSYAACIVSSTW